MIILAMGDTDVASRARHRQTLWLWGSLAVYACLIPIGMIVGYVVIGDDTPDHSFWWFVLIASGAAVLYVGLLMAFVLWRRRRGSRWAQPPLLLGVDRSRRKSILKSVRAGEPVPDDDQVIAADLAHRLIRQRRFIYISPVLVLIWILQLVTRGFDLWSGILVASIALMCASVPYTLRDVRRAHTWLEKYSADLE